MNTVTSRGSEPPEVSTSPSMTTGLSSVRPVAARMVVPETIRLWNRVPNTCAIMRSESGSCTWVALGQSQPRALSQSQAPTVASRSVPTWATAFHGPREAPSAPAVARLVASAIRMTCAAARVASAAAA